MITRNTLPASLSAVVLGFMFLSNPASAQGTAQQDRQAQPAQVQPGDGGATATVSDQKIEAFAVAYLKVDKVRQEYSAKIGATADTAQKQQLQTEASQKMVQAVEGSPDMSVEEYNTILTAAQKDPALVQKVQEKLEKAAPAKQ